MKPLIQSMYITSKKIDVMDCDDTNELISIKWEKNQLVHSLLVLKRIIILTKWIDLNKSIIYIDRALFNFMNHCDNSGVLIGTKPVSLCIILAIIINVVMINSKVFSFLFYFSVKSMLNFYDYLFVCPDTYELEILAYQWLFRICFIYKRFYSFTNKFFVWAIRTSVLRNISVKIG
jgi:hypothetical protein